MMKENQVCPALPSRFPRPRPHAPLANIPRRGLQRAVRRPARVALPHARALLVLRLAPRAGRATAGRGLAAGGPRAPRPNRGAQGDRGDAGRAAAAARQRDGGWGAGTEPRETTIPGRWFLTMYATTARNLISGLMGWAWAGDKGAL